MSPSGWSARGDSNPDLHGLNVPRLPIAPRADTVTTIGPSGWTRTTTSRVKSPACCVDTTEGNRDASSGANDGIRTRTSRLGRPVGDRYPTFALVRHCQLSKSPLRRAVKPADTRHLRVHCLEDTSLSRPGPRPSDGLEAKTKKAFQGIALEGLVLDECRPFRALRPPRGYRASRHGDRSTCTP